MYRHPAGGSAFTLVVVSVFVSALTCLAGYCAPHDRAKSAAAPVKIQAAPPLAVLNPYLQTVKSRVERYWVAAKGSKAHATVAFRINKDGRPYWVELTDAAGLESVNQSAQDAIFYSAPFPPLPAAIGDHLDLAVDFNSDYQPAVQSGYSRPIEASLSASSSLFASATAASKEGKNDVALEKLKKATILTPFDGRLRDALVAAYLAAASSKPSGEAISLMHEALLLDHQNGQARAKLNELIAASGKDPNNFDVRVAMARDYAKASQYDDAIDEYGEAWQIKNDQSLIAEINTTCERRRKYAAILKWQAILRSYDSAESHVALGQAYEACGQPAKTMEEYQKALAMNPDSRSIAAAIHELEEKTRDAATASPAAVSAPAADSGSTDSGSSLSDDFPYADFGTRSLSLRVLPDRKVAIDYLKEASPKLLTRWATNRVPLRVYVENGTGVPGYRPQFRQFMIDAFATWVKASEGRLACTIVDYPKDGNIVCHWISDPAKGKMTGSEQGVTQFKYLYMRNQPNICMAQSAEIYILTLYRHNQAPLSDQAMKCVCLHELGHALGISGHSPHHGDMMYRSFSADDIPLQLTDADAGTIKRLYQGYSHPHE